nr:hypothetical protein [Microbacterium sp. XT11]
MPSTSAMRRGGSCSTSLSQRACCQRSGSELKASEIVAESAIASTPTVDAGGSTPSIGAVCGIRRAPVIQVLRTVVSR